MAAEAGGGPRLLLIYMLDAGQVTRGSLEVVDGITKIQISTEAGAEAARRMATELNRLNNQLDGTATSSRRAASSIETMATVITRFGAIARQAIGIITSWNVWQIRRIQYENQVREAIQRRDKLQRQIIRTDQEWGLVTEKVQRILNKFYKTQLDAVGGFNTLRRATGEAVIAIARFGPESEEAAEAVLEWEDQLLSWAERARAMGVPLEKIQQVISYLSDSVRNKVVPDWRAFSETIGWNTELWGPLGTAGMKAGEIIDSTTGMILNALENQQTMQQEVARAQEEFAERQIDAQEDLVSAIEKLNQALFQQKMQTGALIFEVGGLIVQVAQTVALFGKIPAVGGAAGKVLEFLGISAGGAATKTAAAGTAAGGLGISLGTLGAAIAIVLPFILALYAWWEELSAFWEERIGPAIRELQAAFGSLSEELGISVDWMDVLKGATAPFMWAIKLVILVIEFLIKAVIGWIEIFKEAKKAVEAAGQWLSDLGEGLRNLCFAHATADAEGFNRSLRDVIGLTGETDSIVGQLGETLLNNVGGVLDSLGIGWDDLASSAQAASETMLDVIGKISPEGAEFLRGAFEGLAEAWQPAKIFGEREVGGIIPRTGPYELEAGEVVTPAPLARAGRRVGPTGALAGAPQITYRFGDIHIHVQQLAEPKDFRDTAIQLRRYIQTEASRVRI